MVFCRPDIRSDWPDLGALSDHIFLKLQTKSPSGLKLDWPVRPPAMMAKI